MDNKSCVRIYGVLGFPAKHSLSPLMHNAAFHALQINAEYKIFEIEPGNLEDFISSLSVNSILGLNVTIPYKEKVLPLLNTVSRESELIGAVNTIRVSVTKLEGFNTDGEGFLRHLGEDLKFDPQNKTIAIIGAGGAAKAIAVYLSKNKPKAIGVYDIDKSKSQDLVMHLKQNFSNIEFNAADSPDGLRILDTDMLINATPIGMKDSDPLPVDGKFIQKNLLVYDVIYNPKETKLLTLAKQKGCLCSNGLGMLLYQGARSFELWTGKPAPVEIMREALNKGVNKI